MLHMDVRRARQRQRQARYERVGLAVAAVIRDLVLDKR
jgi:hypothetical protein